MKKIQYILLVCFALLLSCSDNTDMKEGIRDIPENYIQISLEIPKFRMMNTRGKVDEDQINKLDLYFFSSEGNFIAKKHLDADTGFTFNESTGKIEFVIELDNDALKRGTRTMAVVANANEIFDENSLTSKTLFDQWVYKTQDNKVSYSNGLPMYGECELSSGTNNANVSLIRNVAKVTVAIDSAVTDFKLTGFYVCNAASETFISNTGTIPSDNSGNKFITKDRITAESEDINGVTSLYLMPSVGLPLSDSQSNPPAYIIIQGDYNGATGFYRIDFIKKETVNEATTYLYTDIFPNHIYEVRIKSVSGVGYSSPEEAALYPQNSITPDESSELLAEIHDHVAEVMSMVSDGIRELGVTGNIEMENNSNYNAVLTIKCFEPGISLNNYSKPDIEIIEGSDWITLSPLSGPVNSTETSGSHAGDADNMGAIFTSNVSFYNFNNIKTDKEATVRVTWQGLTRDVKITFNTSFDIKDLCPVTLIITKDDNTSVRISQYWYFLTGNGKKNLENYTDNFTDFEYVPRLMGIKPEDLADGKIRNEGFHFPMKYGDNGDWTYSYEVTFASTVTNRLQTIEIQKEGDSFVNTVQATVNGSTVTLSRTGSNDNIYGTGRIRFILKYNNGNPDREFEMDLYHTGFFHYDQIDTYADYKGYYYYEVVPMGTVENGEPVYWLDRNVGARSNMMYSEYSTTSNAGNSNARGRYYTIATKGDYNSQDSDPVIFDDLSNKNKRICPPGYKIPSVAEWNVLRMSSNFMSSQISEGGQTYMATYYRSNNVKIGNIYFPKSRFQSYNNEQTAGSFSHLDPNSGDDACGYYWTCTPSMGMEKDEIGNWLRVLNLAGSSNTYINGSVPFHQMNVRCVAKNSGISDSKHSIEFNVKGATHVYLYTVDQYGNKNGVFTFPGKAIGSSSAVNGLNYNKDEEGDKSYLHFSYTSTVQAENLYVFFVYVDDNGKITILSENGDQTVAGATGWDVYNGYNYFFYNPNTTFNINETRIFPAGGTDNVVLDGFQKDKIVKMVWPKMIGGINMYKIYMFYDNGKEICGKFPGATNDNYDNNSSEYDGKEAYSYTFTLSKDCKYFTVIFSVEDQSHQTEDILVKQDADYVKRIDVDTDGNYTVIMKDNLPRRN